MSEMRTLHMLHSLDVAKGDTASTVRLGGKWADLELDEDIELCVCTKDPTPEQPSAQTHDVQGYGRVFGLWFGRFADIPARFLEYEHEERSRSYRGLMDSMENAYGDLFTPDKPVVVILYYRTA
jgi:hypothetical protein